VPSLSVTLRPETAVIPIAPSVQSREFQVSLVSNEKSAANGTVRLVVPAGWQVEPAEMQFTTKQKGESATARFMVRIPAGAKAGTSAVEAVAVMRGREFRRGYRVVSYPENWTRFLYSNARSEIRTFDLKIAPGLTVGYVPGAGDEVPAALEQLGVKVQVLSGADLAFGDLNRFGAIVTGIRAYNVNEELKANNQRLLDYVARGGTLIVQYNRYLSRGTGGSDFPYGPYPLALSEEERITVEESPLEILEPQSPVFNVPNKITQADFEGWVQERGLCFMRQWDPKYVALLSGNDPAEAPLKGGMLLARYGKGYYIYTAYAWFRQLPAGVSGAYRIFANMLSLGK